MGYSGDFLEIVSDSPSLGGSFWKEGEVAVSLPAGAGSYLAKKDCTVIKLPFSASSLLVNLK